MTADPRIPLEQIPPASVEAENHPNGSTRGTVASIVLPPQEFAHPPLSPGAIWLRRFAVLLFVILCAAMGVLLVILPWSLQWTSNRLLWGYPGLRTWLGYGFVRGLCSGLGILDLWIGFREAARYHEEPHAAK